eukprot:GHVS01019773.1.p1 GENE.GHVS01019773.1~~GHVS01019773.1.p1  ORF type:complete len:349 (+),score=52.54 GHVS01019773.1:404-1450(+)
MKTKEELGMGEASQGDDEWEDETAVENEWEDTKDEDGSLRRAVPGEVGADGAKRHNGFLGMFDGMDGRTKSKRNEKKSKEVPVGLSSKEGEDQLVEMLEALAECMGREGSDNDWSLSMGDGPEWSTASRDEDRMGLGDLLDWEDDFLEPGGHDDEGVRCDMVAIGEEAVEYACRRMCQTHFVSHWPELMLMQGEQLLSCRLHHEALLCCVCSDWMGPCRDCGDAVCLRRERSDSGGSIDSRMFEVGLCAYKESRCLRSICMKMICFYQMGDKKTAMDIRGSIPDSSDFASLSPSLQKAFKGTGEVLEFLPQLLSMLTSAVSSPEVPRDTRDGAKSGRRRKARGRRTGS